jgi:plasmid stabilization system protein ParE
MTSRANRDLIEILDYIESRENDPGPAIRFTNALVEEALSLAELPYRGRIMNRRKRIRKLVFHDYLILFEIKKIPQACRDTPFRARSSDQIAGRVASQSPLPS